MKLYYATGTSALAPHIVAGEASIALDLERVEMPAKPYKTETGRDYLTISPNGYVPLLEFDDGTRLTEVVAIVQYLADLKPDSGLAPAAGTLARYRLQQWLTFVSTELHMKLAPVLYKEYGAEAAEVARSKVYERLAYVETQLASAGSFLLGETFTAADAYLFTVLGWKPVTNVDVSRFPTLQAFMDRVGARPAVREAMLAEGTKVAG